MHIGSRYMGSFELQWSRNPVSETPSFALKIAAPTEARLGGVARVRWVPSPTVNAISMGIFISRNKT